MKSKELSILTKYGIIQERTVALFTDAIRAQKTGKRRWEPLGEVRRMMEQFHLEPAMYRLLAENGMIEE